MQVTLTVQKNVHSKALFKVIQEHVSAVVMLLDLASDIESVVELIELTLMEEVDNYKIDQINVVSDMRNNKLSDLKKGKHIIDIYYRHKNCFNITHLSYTVQR